MSIQYRYLSIGEVAARLERHQDRIQEAVSFGELPSCWSGRERVIPAWAIPPRRQVSEEEG